MPILAKSSSGTVTGLWGSAFVRLPSGKLKPLAVGDEVKKGEHIVTTQDGLVQITPPKGGKPLEVKPNMGKPAHTELAGHGDVDKTIAALERGDQDAVTAAGLDGGASGGLLPGLRVDRVVELVNPLEFQYETARTPVGIPIPAGVQKLFFAEVAPAVQISDVSSASVYEGDSLKFHVTLDRPVDVATPLFLRLHGGTATPGEDTPLTVKVSFDGGAPIEVVVDPITGRLEITVPVGASSVDVQVPTTEDGKPELDGLGNIAPEVLYLDVSTALEASAVVGVGKITDKAVVSISDAAIAKEGDAAVFTVSLDHPTTEDVVITVRSLDGTASGDSDFPGFEGYEVVILKGQTSVTVEVPLNSDGEREPVENFKVEITGVSTNALISPDHGVAQGQIADQEADTPVAEVTGASVPEGDALTFQVNLAGKALVDTPVSLKLVDGSATVGADTPRTVEVSTDGGLSYTPVSLSPDGSFSAVIPSGREGLLVKVPTTPDTIYEDQESLKLTAATSGNGDVPVEGTGTIVDLPQVSIGADVSGNEGDEAVFVITLSKPSATDVMVNLHTENGTTDDDDYVSSPGFFVTILAGETSYSLPVRLFIDSLKEDAETFTVKIDSVESGNATIGKDSAVGTILDGVPPVQIADVSSPSVYEGDDLVFNVKLDRATDAPTPLTMKLISGTATVGEDTPLTVKVSFDGGTPIEVAVDPVTHELSVTAPVGTTSINVIVPTLKDGVAEVDAQDRIAPEDLFLSVSTGAGDNPVVVVGQITDKAVISISDAAIANENGVAVFTVTLDHPTTEDVTFTLSSKDGTATGDADFTGFTLQVTIPAGSTSYTLEVPLLTDDEIEPNENFSVLISDVSVNAVIGKESGIGIISDEPVVASVQGSSVEEGQALVFTVTLSSKSTQDTPLTLQLSDGTGKVGEDTTTPVLLDLGDGKGFQPVAVDANGTINVVVPAGSTGVLLKVPTVDDGLFEGPETIKLSASAAGNGATPVEGTGTIQDNEPTPQLSITGPAIVNEAAGTITYTVKLSNPSALAVTVKFDAVDGTAKAGSDFEATSGTLTFAPNQLEQTITVKVIDDKVFEGAESFKVVLSEPTGAGIAKPSVTTEIRDDGTGPTPPGTPPTDDRPTVSSISSPTASEGQSLDFVVKLSNATTVDTPLSLKLTDGTATFAADLV